MIWAVALYNVFATDTRTSETPERAERPSGSLRLRSGTGARPPGIGMDLAALEVLQGGAKRRATTEGRERMRKSSWRPASDARSMVMRGHFTPSTALWSIPRLSTRPSFLIAAHKPPDPEKMSMNARSESGRPAMRFLERSRKLLFSCFLNNSLHAHKGFRAHLLFPPYAWGMPKRSLPCNALTCKVPQEFPASERFPQVSCKRGGTRIPPPVSKGGLGGPKNWKTRSSKLNM